MGGLLNRRSGLLATIHECDNIRDLLKYCSFNTIIIFDLDNTILRPENDEDLGSDQWFKKILEFAFKKIPQRASAIKSAADLNATIQQHIKMTTVEPDAPRIVKILQDVNLQTMAVTARGYDLVDATRHQLDEISVDLSDGDNEVLCFQIENKMIHFVNGVLYCDGVNKGLCLQALLQIKKMLNCSFVMLDDCMDNLVDVRDVLAADGHDFQGLRYTKSDLHVARFDFKRANSRLSAVSIFLPSSALKIIHELELEECQIKPMQAS